MTGAGPHRPRTMNLVYFGSGSFGMPTLEELRARHRVVLVVTRPDRPAGRHRRLAATPIGQYAAEHGLATIKPGDVNDADAVGRIRKAGADALVVIAFGQKLGRELADGVFAVNLHASLLPRYRGAAPVNWAIINGETETGVSVITISQRIDAGDVVGRRAIPIDPRETAGELERRLAELGPKLMIETLDLHGTGTLGAQPQNDADACRAPRLAKSDGTVRFDQAASAVQRRVHGLNPWPGCTVELGGSALKLNRVEVVDDPDPAGPPGRILDDHTVACAAGRVRLLDVQPPGGKAMTFEAYLRGHAVPGGTGAESRMRSR